MGILARHIRMRMLLVGITVTLAVTESLHARSTLSYANTSEVAIGCDTEGLVSAACYVTNGLVAMWDGIENVGWRRHQDNPSHWIDCIGGAAFTNIGCITTANSFRTTSSHYLRCDDTLNFNGYFMETCARSDAAFSSPNWTIVWFAPGTRQPVLKYSWVWGAWKIAGHNTPRTISKSVFTALCPDTRTGFTISAPTADGSGASANKYVNGMLVTQTGNGAATGSYTFSTIGREPNNTYAFPGQIHCIRIYSRNLTMQEIAHNYAIDRIRFNLP